MVSPFTPVHIDESPGVFHSREFDDVGRALWVPTMHDPPTLVLGSNQPNNDVDHDRLASHGISLAKRRSGGGAVLVGPSELVWFDVVLPKTDPLWLEDVRRSFDWIGLACQRALRSLGVDTDLHTGPLISTTWSRKVCFAGIGPGELTIDGKKLVGMSQRRTRNASRIQVAILRRWDGAQHASFLNLGPKEAERAAKDLKGVATSIPHSPEEILDAVFDELPG